MLQDAYGDEWMSRTQCYDWYHCFKSDRTSIEDDTKHGRSPTSSDDVHVAVVRENRRLPSVK